MAALCKDTRQIDLFSVLEKEIVASEAKPAAAVEPADIDENDDDDFSAEDVETFLSEKGYDFLTAEEEARLIIAYKENGDQKAGRKLYEAFMPMLWSTVRRKCALNDLIDDAFQAASVGFFEAIRHFTPDRGTRLYSYAYREVRSSVVRLLRKNHLTSINVGTKRRGLYYRLIAEESRSTKTFGTSLDFSELERIAEENAIDLQTVMRMHESLAPAKVVQVESLDEEKYVGMHFHDAFDRPDIRTPEESLSEEELEVNRKMILEACLEELDPRERAIIEARFFSENKETLKSLGDRFGVSNEYIRRIQNTALETMKSSAMKLAREKNWDVANLF